MAAPRSKPAPTPDGAPEDTAPPAVPEPPAVVRLALAHGLHTRFIVGRGLPDVVPEGTDYSPADADTVRTLARRYGVQLVDAQPDSPADDEADLPSKEL